ncbi:hypothetical protein ACFYNZ_19055 [Streptomyces kebangsaanensis]|uniref:Class F sortase n=1 Tax=Streptomyces kebangsaanensis TaxID=864058 RepID=A0ABW6KUN0_9ACTN
MSGPDADSDPGSDRVPSRGTGRLLVGLAWVVLLLGVWLWGQGPSDVRQPPAAPVVTGDMAAAGRPAGSGP